jgi:formylglycine-generating enzyme required for sulfatase activity
MRQLVASATLTAAAAFLALVGAGCAIAKAGPAEPGPRPPDLTPVTWLKAPAHPPVEIVRDGQGRAVVSVVDPKGREPFVRKRRGQRPPLFKQLVDQLVETVRLATGATLELVGEPPAADRPAIVIGDCAETRRAGIDAARLPIEGFVVKTAPNRVYLVGSTQALPGARANNATAWAVADFLERFVGVRWYWPAQYGGRSIPRRTSLAIAPAHYRDQPVFRYRTMYQDWYWLQARSFDEQLLPMAPGVLPDGAETLWMGDHFRLMRQGKSWPYEAVHHGARIYEFVRRTPRTSKAVFAVNEDGSLNFEMFCYSAPETLNCYVENLKQAWDGGGKGVYLGGIRRSSVTVWAPLDMGARSLGTACRCPACRATLAKGGEELLMGLFIKRLCEQVKRRWPDKTVIYVPWVIPDCPRKPEFPGNLALSHLKLDVMGLMHQRSVRRVEEDRLRAWSAKSSRRVHTWIDFASPSDWTYGPVQFPHLVQDFYSKNSRFLAGTSVLSYGGACFLTAAPTYYVWNRVLWNPDLDVDATLDEMCRRLFGAGAASARELLRLQCDRWEAAALSRPLRVGENRIPPRLFREIWPPDVVARMKALRDKALAEIERTGDAAARKAFFYWTWEFDAFVEYAGMVEKVMSRAAEVTQSVDTSGAVANDNAAARFRGGPAEINTIRTANVRHQDAPVDGQSHVQFDLSWGHTWRAKWTEPAAKNVTGKGLPVESWSAAWVFAKYKPAGRDAAQGYSHATLSAAVADHVVPDGAGGVATSRNVGLTDGKGMGVFIYRAGPGNGPLDLRNVKLRWLHGADGVADPAKADLKVFAIEMVYVPRGAFKVGSGGREAGSFTDGSWKKGAAIPFLVDASWIRPAAEGTDSRRIGAKPGRLWGTSQEGPAAVGPNGALSDGFPTGYEAFYCMRYEVTRGQFATFLSTVPSDVVASTSAGDDQHAGGHFTAAGRYALSGVWPNLKPARPYQACNLLSWWDGAKFAAWAGLRPMTELEYEKTCRGPRKPVPGEFAWGTAGIATAEYILAGEGQADEHVAENYGTTVGNASYDFTMPDVHSRAARGGVSAVPGSPMRAGIFATPRSGRVAAGASYWGITELSGNVREQVVSVSEAKGRAFQGTHGTGTPEIPEDWPEARYSAGAGRTSGKDDGIGSGLRGGFFGDMPFGLRVSDRSRAAYRPRPGAFNAARVRQDQNGFRGVRTAPQG